MNIADAKYAVAAAAGAGLLGTLLRTTRTEVINAAAFERYHAEGRPVVWALWHGQLLPPTYRHRNRGFVTLASRSGDGEYITRMLHRWGYTVVRGSSSRGGDAALRELVRLVRAGRSVAITADGPRGPRQQLKHGVLQIAQLTGAPIVPVASAASRAWRLGTWDEFTVPRPFARVRIVFGDPVLVPRALRGAAFAAEAARIEAVMAGLHDAAEAPFR